MSRAPFVAPESVADIFRRLGTDMAIPAPEAFNAESDPTGAHILHDGRLWEATGLTYRLYHGEPSFLRLQLRTFDRSETTDAPLSECRVLVRTYPEDSDHA